jgi:hypothetical protein
VGRCGRDSSGLGQGEVRGSCEHSNEPWDSITGGEFLYKLNVSQLLKKDSAP